MATMVESDYYALIYPEAMVYTFWAIGIIIAALALWK